MNIKTGVIKFFKTENKYGFIKPDDGSEDVFLSISTIGGSGYDSVDRYQKVSYELKVGLDNKVEASVIKKLD